MVLIFQRLVIVRECPRRLTGAEDVAFETVVQLAIGKVRVVRLGQRAFRHRPHGRAGINRERVRARAPLAGEESVVIPCVFGKCLWL